MSTRTTRERLVEVFEAYGFTKVPPNLISKFEAIVAEAYERGHHDGLALGYQQGQSDGAENVATDAYRSGFRDGRKSKEGN